MLKQVIEHKYTFYFMVMISILVGLRYLKNDRGICLSFITLFYLLTNKYLTKNKAISLLLAIIVLQFSCSFFVLLGKEQRRVTFSPDTKKE